MKQFLKVSDIEGLDDLEDKLFLTFDVDWASDEVLNHAIDVVEQFDICATFFITHKTPVLQRLIDNPEIELGIHPNFNFLLAGDFRYGRNIDEVVAYYLNFVPDAISVRSHSLVQSSRVLDSFYEHGLKYELNLYIPSSTDMVIKPFYHFSKKLLRLPHYWEDDIHIAYKDPWDPSLFLDKPGLKIFNFHPILVFLNMENMERYERARPHSNDFEKLKKVVNHDEFGTKDFLNSLITKAHS